MFYQVTPCVGVHFVGVVAQNPTWSTQNHDIRSDSQLIIIYIVNVLFNFVCSEVEQNLASAISDRATDEVIEALTRCRRGLDISDSQTATFDNAETPDIVRSRSSQDSMGFLQIRDLDLSQRDFDSPTVSNFGLFRPFSLIITSTGHFFNKLIILF